MIKPSVEPTSVNVALAPREIASRAVVVRTAPSEANVTAIISGDTSQITLTTLSCVRIIKVLITPQEIGELPPFPPQIRERAKKDGFTLEQELVGQSDGITPLPVRFGQLIVMGIDFSAPEPPTADIHSATLTIQGDTWERVQVPLSVLVGKVVTTLSATSIQVRQGQSADLPLSVSSLVGPDTDVTYRIATESHWTVTPKTIHVPRGTTQSTSLQILAAPNAPVGTWPIGITETAFNGLHDFTHPFILTILRGQVSVTAKSSRLSARRSEKVACEIQIATRGESTQLILSPGNLPVGVSTRSQTFHLADNVSTTARLEFNLDAQAPLVLDSPGTINWSAYGGEQTGIVPLTFTVLEIDDFLPQPCKSIQVEISSLEAERNLRAEEFQDASPSQKGAIAEQIRRLLIQIGAKEKQLDECIKANGGLTRIVCAFAGIATLTTSNTNAQGPFRQAVTGSLDFALGRVRVDFGLVPFSTDPFDTGAGQNVTTVSASGSGTFDKASGNMSMDAFMRFVHSHALAGNSTLRLTLTTQGGSPLNPAGNITMVGSGNFEDGFLDGDRANVVIAGTVSPLP